VVAQGGQQARGPVIVSDVLASERLVAAGVHVVAGQTGLDREVTWVHAGEIADIATYLRGGELLLTAGSGVGPSPRAQSRYVESLAAAGASALVLELGRVFKTVPLPMIEAANRLGLPLVLLKKIVPFAEVTREVHAWIIGRRYELRERAEQIALDFNELLLSGGSVAQVVHRLHELTGKPSFLEDAAHHLVEYAGESHQVDEVIEHWGTHTRLDHSPHEDMDAETGEPGPLWCTCAPVVLRGERWGRLHLLRVDTPIDDLDRLAVERAASATGLALMNSRQHARLAERAQADLLAEAARRAPSDPTVFLRQARSLGADFQRCELVAIAIAIGEDSADRAIATATAEAGAVKLPVLCSGDGPICRILIGVPGPQDAREAATGIAARICEKARADAPLTLGLSRPVTVTLLPRAFHEADECLRYARLSESSGMLEYADLGLHLLLAKLADEYELSAFIEAELGPLLEYDARARSPLLPTLLALLEHDNNRAEAARALHMERRSIYYRLERIEAILGKDLDAYDTRLSLGVALRALSLLEDRVHSLRGSHAAAV
jgi:purine catabolism regulator